MELLLTFLSGTGKRILQLQASLSFINASTAFPQPPPPDIYGRTPFQHTALEGIQRLTEQSRSLIEDIENLKGLAVKYRLHHVIRWKPKKVNRTSFVLIPQPETPWLTPLIFLGK